MKRLLLLAIVLFPIITLLLWVFWGTTRPRNASPPQGINSNVNVVPPSR